jgi:hypothetical protein
MTQKYMVATTISMALKYGQWKFIMNKNDEEN